MTLLAWSTVRLASDGSTYAVFSRVFCCSSSSLMPRASFIEVSFGAKIQMISQTLKKNTLSSGLSLTRIVHHLAQTAVRIGRAVFKVEATKAGVQRTRQWLTARNKRAPAPPSIAIVLLLLLLGFLGLFLLHMSPDNLLHVANLNQHILRLEIGMDDTTLPV